MNATKTFNEDLSNLTPLELANVHGGLDLGKALESANSGAASGAAIGGGVGLAGGGVGAGIGTALGAVGGFLVGGLSSLASQSRNDMLAAMDADAHAHGMPADQHVTM